MPDAPAIAIAGAAGRMGREIARLALSEGWRVAGGTEAPGSPRLGEDIARLAGLADPCGASAVEGPAQAAAGADVWIDFTRPAATLAALDAFSETAPRAAVIGTTGFTDEQEAAIAQAARRRAIVKAGNFSLGVALLSALVEQAARALGDGWDVEILETHHNRKLDAPSGTALMLGEAAARGRGGDLATLRASPYDGADAARPSGAIGFAVRRAGGVVGWHEALFASGEETVSLSHQALDRAVFARGALKAAAWAARQAPGLYSIHDVLGL